jgi:hypothetical protein
MPVDFATTRLAGVTQAILDGPVEHSLYDSIILETVAELREYCPPSARDRAGSTGARARPCGGACTLLRERGARVPPVLADAIESENIRAAEWWKPALEATMWRVRQGQVCGTEKVGVFVLWTGMMADLPMRCKMYKNVQWSATYFCDRCGLKGMKGQVEEGRMTAVKAVGCDRLCAHDLVALQCVCRDAQGHIS